ncbi:callose synthase 7-like [Gossypium arboreum]|uniref:callose synthase 7-like n=1 Tax=Gossypium arboreum TaxID=29729 RepID=UPI0022F15245|nr:callose synthase 7-like [Gossypium arboreum]
MASSSVPKRPPPPPPPFARLMRSRDPRNEYNILPFDGSPIMKLPEIEIAVEAVTKMKTLSRRKIDGVDEIDIFNWLSSLFGFQKGNTTNQREHLILLLANIYTRKKDLKCCTEVEAREGAIKQLKQDFLNNYELWCNYMRTKSNIRRDRAEMSHLCCTLSSYMG